MSQYEHQHDQRAIKNRSVTSRGSKRHEFGHRKTLNTRHESRHSFGVFVEHLAELFTQFDFFRTDRWPVCEEERYAKRQRHRRFFKCQASADVSLETEEIQWISSHRIGTIDD